MRLWNQETYQRIRANPAQALEQFLQLPRPIKGNEDPAVVFTTLSKVGNIFYPATVSYRDNHIRELSNGGLSLADSRTLLDSLFRERWQFYCLEEEGPGTPPVCVADFSEAHVALASHATDGKVHTDEVINPILRYIVTGKVWDPNPFSFYWRESGYVLPGIDFTQTDVNSYMRAIHVHNLSLDRVREYGKKYLASVLVGINHRYRQRFSEATSPVLSVLYNKLIEMGLPASDHTDTLVPQYLKTLPFIIHTNSREIADLLVEMGGKKRQGTLTLVPTTLEEYSAYMSLSESPLKPGGWLVWIDPAILTDYERMFALLPLKCAEHFSNFNQLGVGTYFY